MKRNKEDGFTLIEVIIAMVIVLFISMAIYQLTTSSSGVALTMKEEGEFQATIRVSTNLLERDISQIYTPRNAIVEADTKLTDQEIQLLAGRFRGEENVVGEYWSQIVDRFGNRYSRFIGEEDYMSFVSASHIKVYKEAPESIFIRVKYELKADENPPEGVENSSMLVRITDSNVFGVDDNEENDQLQTHQLLGGITRFKLSYFHRQQSDRWLPRWKSDDPEFDNRLPELIKVEFTALGGPKQEYVGSYIFKPETPYSGLYSTN